MDKTGGRNTSACLFFKLKRRRYASLVFYLKIKTFIKPATKTTRKRIGEILLFILLCILTHFPPPFYCHYYTVKLWNNSVIEQKRTGHPLCPVLSSN